MAGLFAKVINGTEGDVWVPGLGALLGYFNRWSLVADERTKSYTLTAQFAHVNEALWADPELGKSVVLKLSRDLKYRLEQKAGAEMSRDGNALVMKEVSLCPVEQ